MSCSSFIISPYQKVAFLFAISDWFSLFLQFTSLYSEIAWGVSVKKTCKGDRQTNFPVHTRITCVWYKTWSEKRTIHASSSSAPEAEPFQVHSAHHARWHGTEKILIDSIFFRTLRSLTGCPVDQLCLWTDKVTSKRSKYLVAFR